MILFQYGKGMELDYAECRANTLNYFHCSTDIIIAGMHF
jgi:hypothetical protein